MSLFISPEMVTVSCGTCGDPLLIEETLADEKDQDGTLDDIHCTDCEDSR